MSLADQLRKMMGERPKPAPAPPIRFEPKKAPANVVEQALATLKAAGRFGSAEGHDPIITPQTKPMMTGLFQGIGRAGPKPRKKAEEKKEPVKKLSLQLLQEMGVDEIPFDRRSKVGQAFRAAGVSESVELERIMRLPRRVCVFDDYEDLTARFRKTGGTMAIWPLQSAALHEARKANGLLGLLAAGAGKTLISLLVGDMLDAKSIVLFVPPQLRPQLLTRDIPRLNEQFKLPLDRLRVVAYSELSSAKSADLLEELKPDIIVSDECFPYETLVTTDVGDVPIGDVVDKRVGNTVLSFNPIQKIYEWKPLLRRIRRPSTKRLVKVTHEQGEFICTEDHKVYVEGIDDESSYVEAKKLGPDHLLRLWRPGAGPQSQRQVLLPKMQVQEERGLTEALPLPGAEELYNSDQLSVVRKAQTGKEEGQDYGQALLSAVRLLVPAVLAQNRSRRALGQAESNVQGLETQSRTARQASHLYSLPDGVLAKALQDQDVLFEVPGCIDIKTHEDGQPDEEAWCSGQNVEVPQRKDFSISRGEREDHSSSGNACQASGLADGAQHTNQAGAWTLQEFTDSLQGGLSEPGAQDSSGGGRQHPQDAEMALSRQPQRGGPVLSRVVGVEALESGDLGRSGERGSISVSVYDLEVGDNHNYFAAGVLVSNCHNFRHRSAARTKRFLRYMKDHPECRFVGLSGTITRRSLKDYGHLAELALRGRSPVPHSFHTLSEWSEAIDVATGSRPDPLPAGALRKLCNDDELAIIDSTDALEAQPAVRSAFRRRLVETPGVVATEEGAIGTSLVLTGLNPIVPADVKIALNDLRSTWCVGGDELVDILSVIRAGCQLSAGFYTKWDWPDGIPDREWLDGRSAWLKELREILKLSRKGLDSPLLVTNAIRRGELESSTWSEWERVRQNWDPEPPRMTVWISDFLVQEAVRWGKETCDKANGGIIWFQHRALGEAIAKVGGFPFFGGGEKASEELTRIAPKQAPVIVCSQKAHGTGMNLQAYCRNLFTTPPAAVEAEQTIARTHRPGQLADEVTVDIYVHTDEMKKAFLNCLRDARYTESSMGQRQKCLYAERIALPEEE